MTQGRWQLLQAHVFGREELSDEKRSIACERRRSFVRDEQQVGSVDRSQAKLPCALKQLVPMRAASKG
jgi:hypothetical protein